MEIFNEEVSVCILSLLDWFDEMYTDGIHRNERR